MRARDVCGEVLNLRSNNNKVFPTVFLPNKKIRYGAYDLEPGYFPLATNGHVHWTIYNQDVPVAKEIVDRDYDWAELRKLQKISKDMVKKIQANRDKKHEALDFSWRRK